MACKRSAVRSRLAPPDFVQDRFDFRPASPSSRGLGHIPFTDATGVRIPVGTPFFQLLTSWGVAKSNLHLALLRARAAHRPTNGQSAPSMNSDEERKGDAELEQDDRPKRKQLVVAVIGAPFAAGVTRADLIDGIAQ
jgi:hypothetical protein